MAGFCGYASDNIVIFLKDRREERRESIHWKSFHAEQKGGETV
jgi:hypothetical protein